MTDRKYPAGSYRLSLIRSTPFPNRLLEAAFLLPETELRLLCLVVRETLGWAGDQPGTRRSVAFLPVAVIQRRIGRSDSAVTEAIDGLVRRGLLEVVSTAGTVLISRRDRRRVRSVLGFRLVRGWVETAAPTVNAAADTPQGAAVRRHC